MQIYRLNEEKAEKLRAYMPVMEKAAFVERAASRCFDRLEVGYHGNGMDLPLAPMYKENPQLPARYLMGVLVKFYLGESFEGAEEDPELMSADDYDRWARADPLGQLIQWKSKDPGVRETAAFLLRDYHDLEKRFYREIAGLLQVMNDPLGRLFYVLESYSQTGPDAWEKGVEDLKKVRDELEAYRKGKEKAREKGEGRAQETEEGARSDGGV